MALFQKSKPCEDSITKYTAAWVNYIVAHALETEKTNKKSGNKKK